MTALFLALAAIQFVIMGLTPASSYITALMQLVLMSYVCLVLVALENLLIWFLTIYHKDKERCVRKGGGLCLQGQKDMCLHPVRVGHACTLCCVSVHTRVCIACM